MHQLHKRHTEMKALILNQPSNSEIFHIAQYGSINLSLNPSSCRRGESDSLLPLLPMGTGGVRSALSKQSCYIAEMLQPQRGEGEVDGKISAPIQEEEKL